jgi:hypothetical protein
MDLELNDWREKVCGCGDVQLMAELQKLVRIDRRCEGRLLVCLAEVDGRRLFLEQGYSSLFRYAVGVLRMSEAQAYLRIQAARVAKAYPVVFELLAEGAVNLSTLKMLDAHLTSENHVALPRRRHALGCSRVTAMLARGLETCDIVWRAAVSLHAKSNSAKRCPSLVSH